MPQFQQNVEVVHRERMADQVIRLTFSAGDMAAVAHPGQFVMVQTSSGLDPLLRRPFSIHQIDGQGHLQILFKVIGKGTRQLAAIGAGDWVSLLGPLGKGFVIDSSGEACLVGGGMGGAPMLFLASRIRQHSDAVLRVILGARNRAELEPLVPDFEKLGAEVLTATDDGSYGHHGLVTDVFRKIDLPPTVPVYCCGPRPMMAAIAHLCRGPGRRCQVSVETVMACGMGACLGCAVPLKGGGFAHVCSDGPVFEAQSLLWSLEP